MRSVFFLCLAALLNVSLVAAQDAPVFEPSPCPDGVAATECGTVTVPANHANPDGEQLRLPVAITRAGEPGQTPLFFLAGGPGESGLAYSVMSQFITDRDIVVFDQRGAGIAEPALFCMEYGEVLAQSVMRTSAELNAALIDALNACGARFTEEGLPLDLFNATQSAADVDAIRQALGYEQINLWGASYGTRLAQEVMRRFPDSLRAVILDSVIPPEVDRPAETVRGVASALDAVFAACAADAACDAAHPELAERYHALMQSLAAEPYVYTVTSGDTTVDVPIDDSTVAGLMLASMYTAPGVAQVPAMIDAFSRDDYSLLETSAAAAFGEAVISGVSMGMFFATECRGEVAFSDADAMSAAYDELPEWRGVLGSAAGLASERVYDICTHWGLMTPSGDENTPLVSDVPTLVMTGEFDPATPPAWVALAADGLSESQTFIIPGQAHSPGLTSECGYALATAFLADPTQSLDASCLESSTLTFE